MQAFIENSITTASLRTAACGIILAAFDDYIRHGGFPEMEMVAERQRHTLQRAGCSGE